MFAVQADEYVHVYSDQLNFSVISLLPNIISKAISQFIPVCIIVVQSTMRSYPSLPYSIVVLWLKSAIQNAAFQPWAAHILIDLRFHQYTEDGGHTPACIASLQLLVICRHWLATILQSQYPILLLVQSKAQLVAKSKICVQLSATLQVAVTPKLSAVIVQVHGVTQVTNQLLLTVATVVSLELQVTVAHAGTVVAVICAVSPALLNLIEPLSKVREVTSIHSQTNQFCNGFST